MTPFEEGAEAKKEGRLWTDCPYSDTHRLREWFKGWDSVPDQVLSQNIENVLATFNQRKIQMLASTSVKSLRDILGKSGSMSAADRQTALNCVSVLESIVRRKSKAPKLKSNVDYEYLLDSDV